MTHYFDELPYPPFNQLGQEDRDLLAYELHVVAVAARQRAGILKSAGQRSTELAIVELETFAGRVQARADAYRDETQPIRPADDREPANRERDGRRWR